MPPRRKAAAQGRPRRSTRTTQPSQRVREANADTPPPPAPPPEHNQSYTQIPDSQPSSQSTLRSEPIPPGFNSQSASSNVSLPPNRLQQPLMTDIQTFLERERAYAARTSFGPEAEAAMLAEATRLQDARLQAEAHVLQPRVSFTHVVGTNPPPFSPSLVKSFPAINRKYFIEIFRGTFNVDNLHKLSNDYSSRSSLGEKDKEDFSEPKSLSFLMKCFEAYCQIVLEFASEQLYRPLQFAMSQYRLRLHLLSGQYTFDSVAAFHRTFVYARICEGQDDPTGWVTVDHSIEQNHLVRKIGDAPKQRIRDSPNHVQIPTGYCRKFNLSSPCSGCSYKHNCSLCESPDHAAKVCPTSSTNRTPINHPRRH